MLRQVKPKNARAKRAMDKREPQINENPKTTLFVAGQKTSQILKLCTADLRSLKKPLVESFMKKNDIHPFEDASSLEFFSLKNDTSLLALSIHSKKRPHCLTLARTHAHKILDMLELYLDPSTFLTLQQFKNKKPAVGLKPMLAFHGAVFETESADDSGVPHNKWTLAKSLLVDFFRGADATEVDVEGLQYLISITGSETPSNAEGVAPKHNLKIRFYLIKTLKSGQKLPRIEVEEMGPRIDATLGREQIADPDVMKAALKKPKGVEPRTKKNIDMDIMGDQMGKIHLPRQNLKELQTRKMKGLKRGRTPPEEGGVEAQAEADVMSLDDEELAAKRTKV